MFLKQVYTDREVRFCNGKKQTTEHFTALWAAKEAVFRALGTTWKRGMNWTDVEIVHDNGGPPHAVVSGATRELMAARGVNHILLTMAFCRSFATATAIAVHAVSPAGRGGHGTGRLTSSGGQLRVGSGQKSRDRQSYCPLLTFHCLTTEGPFPPPPSEARGRP